MHLFKRHLQFCLCIRCLTNVLYFLTILSVHLKRRKLMRMTKVNRCSLGNKPICLLRYILRFFYVEYVNILPGGLYTLLFPSFSSSFIFSNMVGNIFIIVGITAYLPLAAITVKLVFVCSKQQKVGLLWAKYPRWFAISISISTER